ncbi:MAG: DUF4352 domain-containing protein [Clostridia bacterium]|nr:DUF4352 domain-containing protein [Clostridia bacterium]
MGKTNKIMIAILFVIMLALIVVDIVVYVKMDNKLKESYAGKQYVAENTNIDNTLKTVTIKVDEDFEIVNSKFTVKCLNHSSATSIRYKVGTNQITGLAQYETENTDNLFLMIEFSVTNTISNRVLTFSPGGFDLISNSEYCYYDESMILDSNSNIVNSSETFNLQPNFSKNFIVVFEIPKVKDNYSLINNNLFAVFDDDSDWKIVYEMMFKNVEI